MATDSIWIAVVSILAMFDITKEIGEDGRPIEPSYKYEGGALLYGNSPIWLDGH